MQSVDPDDDEGIESTASQHSLIMSPIKDDKSVIKKVRISVGSSYQASIPTLLSAGDTRNSAEDLSLLLWAPPPPSVSDEEIDQYVEGAITNFGYNTEQAHGMLFWHKYDIKLATADLANFTPGPDIWTAYEKTLFNKSLKTHKKNFGRIQQEMSVTRLVTFLQVNL